MELLVEIVTKIGEHTVAPVIRQVGYTIHYKKNLKKLESEVDKLGNARESMRHSVETEERKGRKIEVGVQKWLTEVNQLTEKADDFLKDEQHTATKCLQGCCPNIKLRHHLSRKSTKLALEVAELNEKRNAFSNIAYDASPQEMCTIAIQDYEAFDSRTSTVKDVIAELRKSNTYMIGVYGIGGVGKTTLVKEVYKQVTRGEKLFDEVVMVLDLKQNPSIERIQKEIAEKLGLELSEAGTPAGRATQICNRIKDKKSLVILDDVWEYIDLEAVGLPRMTTLTILLTSRNKIVLASEMGTQKEFLLEELNREESWSLFKKMAGDIVEKPDIQTTAAQVAEKCGGLPLLIVTVARALKDSPLHVWKDKLRRLKNLDGEGLTKKTYSAIEWSYSKLESEELKSVFLLCATEVVRTNSSHILDLFKYTMGLGFLKDVDTIEEARDALHSLLKELQHSCLLQNNDDDRLVRVHDLVKDVGKQIADRDHHVLSVSDGSELKKWPDKESCEKYTRISLNNCNTPKLPEVLQCPVLTMFHMGNDDVDSREIPKNLFKEMKKLKVLDLTSRIIPSLPPSLQCLKDLQTLCLDACTLGDIALVGELTHLKVLSFLGSKFKELPKEIGQLTHLQLLDLTGCSQLEVITPDVLSKLEKLEELRMGQGSFNKWEHERGVDAKRSNASLEELKYLHRLTALQIHIPDAHILPADLFTTSNLQRFQICIGSVWKWDDVDEALNALKLHLTTNNELDGGLKILLKRTQDLHVEGMEGVNNKFFGELAAGGFQQLKHLHIHNSAEFSYIIYEKVGFPNLTWLAVSELKGIRFLLSYSMARSLSQLKRLQISGCQIMEEIISVEESNTEIVDYMFCQLQQTSNEIEFMALRHLELSGLPSMRGFCLGSHSVKFPSLETLSMTGCTQLEGFLFYPTVEITTIGQNSRDTSSNENAGVVQPFLFDNKVEFPKLKSLSLKGLPKFSTIWHNLPSTQLQSFHCENLEYVEIDSCENLINIFPMSVAKNLQQFKKLIVTSCGVKEIVAREEGLQIIPKLVFSKVTYVKFYKLPQIINFYPGMHVSSWPSLLHLAVVECFKVHKLAEEMSICHGYDEQEHLFNSIPRSLFLIHKDSFPNLEMLFFEGSEIWEGQLPVHLLSKLKHLLVAAPQSKSAVFLESNNSTSSGGVVGTGTHWQQQQQQQQWQLPHLTELRLIRMEKLMHLGQEDEDDNSQSAPNIPNLQILLVIRCHSLRNLRSSAICLNNLTTLQASFCKRLEYLITYSMANSLMQLTTLEVTSCRRLMVIVGSINEDNDSRNEITFRRLKHLKLSGLSRLRSFCSGNCIAKFPSLETSTMSNRLKLKISAAHDQTLQLTTEEEDTDVDAWEKRLTAEDEMNTETD